MWPLNICIQVCAASEGDGDRAEYHDSAMSVCLTEDHRGHKGLTSAGDSDGQAVKKRTFYTSTVGTAIKAVTQENTSSFSYHPTFSQIVAVDNWHPNPRAEAHGRRRPPPIRTNEIWASSTSDLTAQSLELQSYRTSQNLGRRPCGKSPQEPNLLAALILGRWSRRQRLLKEIYNPEIRESSCTPSPSPTRLRNLVQTYPARIHHLLRT